MLLMLIGFQTRVWFHSPSPAVVSFSIDDTDLVPIDTHALQATPVLPPTYELPVHELTFTNV